MELNIFSESVNSLPPPWNVTNNNLRDKLVEDLTKDWDNLSTAIAVLEVFLKYVSTHERIIPSCYGSLFPEDVFYSLRALNKSFTNYMPTFSDVTTENIYQWLTLDPRTLDIIFNDNAPGPSLEIARDIGMLWTNGKLESIICKATWWSRYALRDIPDKDQTAAERAKLAAICKQYGPQIEPNNAYTLLMTLRYITPPHAEDDFYAELSVDSDVRPEIQEHAQDILDFVPTEAPW